MHIAEGFLPPAHAAGWAALALPFVAVGLGSIKRILRQHPECKPLLGVAGAYAFVLSALKLPSVTGSSSHPTGVGMGALLIGPAAMGVLGMVVLLFQALLLAHGGLSTLGANVISMAVVGPWVAFAVFRLLRPWSFRTAVFLSAALGNLATYLTTATQLALAFPDPHSGWVGAFAKFAGIYALTQVPLAVGEGVLSVLVVNVLLAHNAPQLRGLSEGGRLA